MSSKHRGLKNKLKQQQGKRCHYCGKILTNEAITFDHLTPQCRGGKTTANNLVVCCSKCNVEKSKMTENQYWKYLAVKKTLLLEEDTSKMKTLKSLFLQSYFLIQKLNPTEIVELLRKNYLACYSKIEFHALRAKNNEIRFINKGTINLDDIKIFSKFKVAPPRIYKVIKAINYYNIHKKLDKPLTIVKDNDNNNILVDGYSRYCALQDLCVPYASAKFYAIR